MTASPSTASPPDATCRARPMTVRSQPMPTAPGPNSSQWASTGATCSSSKRARPSPSSDTRTSIHVVASPNSQVAAKRWGGSHSVIVPPALPSSWYRPPRRRSPVTGRNQRGIRSGLVQASHSSSTVGRVGLAHDDGAGLAGVERAGPDLAGHGVDLVGDVDHRAPRLLPPAGQLGGQGIEGLGPLPAEPVDPLVDLLHRLGPHGVEPAGAVGPHGGEAATPGAPAGAGTRRAGRCRTPPGPWRRRCRRSARRRPAARGSGVAPGHRGRRRRASLGQYIRTRLI